MRTALCLPWSALALWVTLVLAAPHSRHDLNLNEIMDLIKNYVPSLSKDGEYVDSARRFAQGPGRCGETFFCAVRDTIHKHYNGTRNEQGIKIVGNLNNFLRHKHVNCTKALMNVTGQNGTEQNGTEQLTLPVFLSDVKDCIRCRNLNPNSTSCSE